MINSRQTDQLDPGPVGEPVQEPARSMQDVLSVTDPRNSEVLGEPKIFSVCLATNTSFPQ